jgi:hypothetical protein
MEQSPSWESKRFSASQVISCIYETPKIYYRIHKYPQPVPILSQLDPVHTPIMSNAVQHNLQIHNIYCLIVPYEINPLKISPSAR